MAAVEAVQAGSKPAVRTASTGASVGGLIVLGSLRERADAFAAAVRGNARPHLHPGAPQPGFRGGNRKTQLARDVKHRQLVNVAKQHDIPKQRAEFGRFPVSEALPLRSDRVGLPGPGSGQPLRAERWIRWVRPGRRSAHFARRGCASGTGSPRCGSTMHRRSLPLGTVPDAGRPSRRRSDTSSSASLRSRIMRRARFRQALRWR